MGKPSKPDIYRSPNLSKYEEAVMPATMNRVGAGNVSGAGSYNYGGSAPATNNPNYAPTGGVPRPASNQTSGYNSGGGALRMNAANTPSSFNYGPGVIGKSGINFGNVGGKINVADQNQGPAAMSDMWNTGNIGAPLGGKSGLDVATSPYDWNPTNQAISGLSKGTTQNPYQFNFGQLPDQYTQDAYQLGSSNISRAGANQAAQAKEAIGTRRPGLLLNATENANRETGRNLAQLGTNLNLNRINQNLQLGKEQQTAQAGENANAQGRILQYLTSLAGAGQNKIGQQSNLLENERNYQDKGLQYLQSIYNNATGQANQAAAMQASQQGGAMSGLLGLGQLGLGIAGLLGTGGAAAPFAGLTAAASLL